MSDDLCRVIDEGLAQVAQVLAVGTGESQLHAAAEHIAHALDASSVTVLALVSDLESVYIVADSDEAETGRTRLPLAQYPYISRALGTGEVTFSGAGSGQPMAAQISAVFPMVVGRKPLGALLVRLPAVSAAAISPITISAGKMAAGLVAMVLRGARALDPIRERTRKITLQDFHEERRVKAIERYRAFIDSASDGIVVVDASGQVLYINRAAQEITGYARDGLVGRALKRIVSESYRPRLEEAIARAAAAEPVDNFDLEVVTTSGDHIVVSVASIGILSEHEAAIFA
ncbi:MAG: hypothetical protein QOI66_4587, partial [Myxococcales bacterium]|nr:hypothetical protein [Myxococcales bacterium]